jgi:hypothetical protein
MTPQERRERIIKRIQAGGWSNYYLVRQSGFTGLQGYRDGKTSSSDKKINDIEQALTRLESK